MELLTASAIATLAFSKFFDTAAERYSEAVLDKMEALRKRIWEKLRGNDRAKAALQAAETGDKKALEEVESRLKVAMADDEEFEKAVQQLAREIVVEIGDVEGEVWNVFGGNVNYNKQNQAPVYQATTQHFYQQPPQP